MRHLSWDPALATCPFALRLLWGGRASQFHPSHSALLCLCLVPAHRSRHHTANWPLLCACRESGEVGAPLVSAIHRRPSHSTLWTLRSQIGSNSAQGPYSCTSVHAHAHTQTKSSILTGQLPCTTYLPVPSYMHSPRPGEPRRGEWGPGRQRAPWMLTH